MPTTPGGLPYPAPSDQAQQGPAQLQALATALAAKFAAPTFQVVPVVITPNGNGDAVVTFPRLASVQGAVAQIVGQPGEAIVSSLQGWAGQTATFRFTRLGQGYTVNNTPWTAQSWCCAIGWA